MPRTLGPSIALATSLILAGCGARIETPTPSLKDSQPRLQHAVARPDAPPSAVVRRDITIAPAVVTGGTSTDNARLALALDNALLTLGYDVRPGGPWRITGTITDTRVTWTITDPAGITGTVTQSSTSTPALQAIVPGVRSHLPRPSTPT